MITNHTSCRTGYFAGRYPNKIGLLFSPGQQRGPFEFMDYALDNGAYTGWDEAEWLKLLEWAKLSGQKPRWVLVPDVVGDREGTLKNWRQYAPVAAKYGWPLAFAAQDGMTLKDVPSDASLVFIGGSFDWKWRSVARWCEQFPRVHVGRVNTYGRLWECHDAGAESCDGTGFMRGNQYQHRGLLQYLEESTDRKKRHMQLELGTKDLLCVGR